MQYHCIADYNNDMFEQVMRCGFNIVIDELYQIASHRSYLDRKILILRVFIIISTPNARDDIVLRHIISDDYILMMFGSWVEN